MTEERIEKEVIFLHEVWISGNRKYVVTALLNRIKEDIRVGVIILTRFRDDLPIQDKTLLDRIIKDMP